MSNPNESFNLFISPKRLEDIKEALNKTTAIMESVFECLIKDLNEFKIAKENFETDPNYQNLRVLFTKLVHMNGEMVHDYYENPFVCNDYIKLMLGNLTNMPLYIKEQDRLDFNERTQLNYENKDIFKELYESAGINSENEQEDITSLDTEDEESEDEEEDDDSIVDKDFDSEYSDESIYAEEDEVDSIEKEKDLITDAFNMFNFTRTYSESDSDEEVESKKYRRF